MKAHFLVLALSMLAPITVYAGLSDAHKAAEAGDADRQLELGELYEYGSGLSQNQVPALTWYIVAAEHGNQQATQRRDALQKRMSSPQIADAQRQSQILLQATAQRPDVSAAAPATSAQSAVQPQAEAAPAVSGGMAPADPKATPAAPSNAK